MYEFGLEIDFPRLVAECLREAEPGPMAKPIYLTFVDVILPLTIKENELFALAGFLLRGLYMLITSENTTRQSIRNMHKICKVKNKR